MSHFFPRSDLKLDRFPLMKDPGKIIPYALAKEQMMVPLEMSGDKLVIAMPSLGRWVAIQQVRLITGRDVVVKVATAEAILQAIEIGYGKREEIIFQGEIPAVAPSVDEEMEGYDLLSEGSESPAIQTVNWILRKAIQQGASDIHFEPTEEGLHVRFRLDGVLAQEASPPKHLLSSVITRLKVMGKLDIAESRLPQDGRIKLRYGERAIDFRVSTIPTAYGERLVLRILDKGNLLLGLKHLGMPEKLLVQIQSMIECPEGILLVTGPTGSGKTTTLYSAMSELSASEMNIMTIEDPVEYKLAGIAQMSVNPKIDLDFAKGLRHLLRQDPDVILIGEIRDRETAEIAIQASLTGHLVFTTLHTNDAPSAITRLVDMGIEPYLLASSLLGVLSQRLLRKVCRHCTKGCADCLFTGFKGRHPIYEWMAMTPRLKRQVMISPDAEHLRAIALEEGLSPLHTEAMHLVSRGVTTLEEALRVTRKGNEKELDAAIHL